MTIEQAQSEIIAEFNQLDDTFERYEHLIALGKAHPPLDDQFKTDDHALPGCQSQVWIRATLLDDRLHLTADSDSHIIRGTLALMLRVLNHHHPADVASADLHFVQDIGLTASLSPSRATGVATIINHIQQTAANLCDTANSTA